jgi:hypothetical protein
MKNDPNQFENLVDSLMNDGPDGGWQRHYEVDEATHIALNIFAANRGDYAAIDRVHDETPYLGGIVPMAEHRARRAIVERAVRSVLRPSSRR